MSSPPRVKVEYYPISLDTIPSSNYSLDKAIIGITRLESTLYKAQGGPVSLVFTVVYKRSHNRFLSAFRARDRDPVSELDREPLKRLSSVPLSYCAIYSYIDGTNLVSMDLAKQSAPPLPAERRIPSSAAMLPAPELPSSPLPVESSP